MCQLINQWRESGWCRFTSAVTGFASPAGGSLQLIKVNKSQKKINWKWRHRIDLLILVWSQQEKSLAASLKVRRGHSRCWKAATPKQGNVTSSWLYDECKLYTLFFFSLRTVLFKMETTIVLVRTNVHLSQDVLAYIRARDLQRVGMRLFEVIRIKLRLLYSRFCSVTSGFCCPNIVSRIYFNLCYFEPLSSGLL